MAFGLEKTGGLISSAAAIMVVAFSGFLIGHEIHDTSGTRGDGQDVQAIATRG